LIRSLGLLSNLLPTITTCNLSIQQHAESEREMNWNWLRAGRWKSRTWSWRTACRLSRREMTDLCSVLLTSRAIIKAFTTRFTDLS